MTSCIADNCLSTSDTPGVVFFRFPENDDRKLWLLTLSIKNPISDESVVCSNHFTAGDLDETSDIVRIKPGKYPTIFTSRTVPENKERISNVNAIPETINDNGGNNTYNEIMESEPGIASNIYFPSNSYYFVVTEVDKSKFKIENQKLPCKYNSTYLTKLNEIKKGMKHDLSYSKKYQWQDELESINDTLQIMEQEMIILKLKKKSLKERIDLLKYNVSK